MPDGNDNLFDSTPELPVRTASEDAYLGKLDTIVANSRDEMTSGAVRRAIRGIDIVDNYRIISELGHGGMAIVYRAEDTRLHRQVALKILHEHIASRAENRERFVREARAVARLAHPNIIDIYGFSSPSAPVQYIAAELIEGQTLRSLVQSKRYSLPEVGAMVTLQVARGLAAAHDEGIIHRDVKPENVMVSASGVPKLMDFGLARLLDAKTLTMTGAILGSPAHMSPETIEGAQADERVDVFALGTVLYYATVGELPFDGNSPAAILNVVLNGIYVPAEQANPLVARTLSRIIDRCIARDPAERYPNAGAVAEALDEWLSGLGLGDTAGELRRYFASPDTGTRRLKRTLITALEARAVKAQADGQIGTAVAACGRILTLDPDHVAAKRLLTSIKAGKRRRLIGLALLSAVIAVVATGVALAGRDTATMIEPEPVPRIAGRELPTPNPGAATAEASRRLANSTPYAMGVATGTFYAEAMVDAATAAAEAFPFTEAARIVAADEARIDAESTAEARNESRPPTEARSESTQTENADAGSSRDAEATPVAALTDTADALGDRRDTAGDAQGSAGPREGTASAVLHDVRLRIRPPSARVRINGQDFGDASQARSVRLPAGTHTLELFVSGLSNGRYSETFTVLDGGLNDFPFRVPWPDGFVTVRSNAPGNVAIDGRVYRTNERIPIAVDTDDPTRRLLVEILPPNAAPYRQEVTVRTDQNVVVSTDF